LTAVSVARSALILLMHAVRDAAKPSADVMVPASGGGSPASVPELLPLDDVLPLEDVLPLDDVLPLPELLLPELLVDEL
jgi:hypothetical protein